MQFCAYHQPMPPCRRGRRHGGVLFSGACIPGMVVLAVFAACCGPDLASSMLVKSLDELPAGPDEQDCLNPANAIVRENCLPGRPAHEWDISGAGDASIQGFATGMSYLPGERIDFKVKTDSASYRFDIYRLGWYAGLGARLLDSFEPSVPLPQLQPDCYSEEETRLVDCGTWAVSGSWVVPADATSGVYVARLVRNDPAPSWRTDASQILPSSKFRNKAWDVSKMPPCGDLETCPGLSQSFGAQQLMKGPRGLMRNALTEPRASHIYFVVRDDSRQADILLQTIDVTSRAYNNYAGPSTYGVLPLSHHNFSIPASWDGTRAYKVSYNVPLITRDVRAVNVLFNAEFPAIRYLERHGYDVQYWSGVDAHVRGGDIRKHCHVYVSVGHDEYWSGEQRSYVEAARDQGVHLMFWSGNEVYWKVRWEASPVDGQAMRTVAVYKESQESYKIDPEKHVWTGTFRDSREINPEGGWPENALTGTIFTVNAWRNDPLEVPGIYAPLRFWRHTAVAQLQPRQKAVLLKGLLGHEFDEDMDNGWRPPGMIRLSATTVDNVQYLVDVGSFFDSGSATHHLVLYKANSGALVFGAGTVQWAWGLDNFHDSPTGLPNMVENEYSTRIGVDLAGPDPVIQQATMNLFADMGVQPTVLGSGMVRPSASTDDQQPVITSVDWAPRENSVFLSATGSDTGGVVAALEWTMDDGNAGADAHWHPMKRSDKGEWYAELAPGTEMVRVRAIDDSLNIGPAVTKRRSVEL